MPGRRLYFFFIELWPQEIYYLTGVLILGAVGIFFITSLLGRVWCGYACPQTVWTEIFMWFERKIEGDRPKQMKLDKAPWTAHKVMIKGSKHTVWFVFAAFTGFFDLDYFSCPLGVGLDYCLVADLNRLGQVYQEGYFLG